LSGLVLVLNVAALVGALMVTVGTVVSGTASVVAVTMLE
jgi:hypothetical protein